MNIKKKLKEMDIVIVKGEEFAACNFITEQTAKHKKAKKIDIIADIKTYIKELESYCENLGKASDKVIKLPSRKVTKGALIGYEKPEITVYRIHRGNVLTSSSSYVGLNYKIKQTAS